MTVAIRAAVNNTAGILAIQGTETVMKEILVVKEELNKTKLEVSQQGEFFDLIVSNDKEKNDLLMKAASDGKVLVKRLLRCGANVAYRDNNNISPIHLAAMNGHLKSVIDLIESGAKVDVMDTQEQRPLHYALKNGHMIIARALMDRGANGYERTGEHGEMFILPQNSDLLRDYLINVADDVEEGGKAIMTAARLGYTEEVKLLVAHGVDVNTKDEDQNTALHYAASNGRIETLRSLVVDLGADLNAKDGMQSTPLHDAAGHGHTEAVQALIALGADVNARSEFRRTPLHRAAHAGRVDTVRVLVTLGAEVATPLHDAASSWVSNDQVDTIRVLIELGADVSTKDIEHQTPFDVARDDDVKQELIDLGFKQEI